MNNQTLKPETNKNEPLKKKKGLVISDKMDKTIVVSIVEIKTHPKYLKKFKSTNKYKVHDEKNEYKVGDKVFFVECSPFSKEKCWKVVGKVGEDDNSQEA